MSRKYQYDQRRGNRHQRGYTNKWDKAAKAYLASHPWCALCEKAGKRTEATCVDHIEPHKQDMRKFWNSQNWQPLCDSCHSAKTRSEMTGSAIGGCDANGIPIDPGHLWNRGGGGGNG